MAAAIPRFIQLLMPLPPLKLMDQLRLGVAQFLESQAHLLAMMRQRQMYLNKSWYSHCQRVRLRLQNLSHPMRRP
jgi:hypothetical protein